MTMGPIFFVQMPDMLLAGGGGAIVDFPIDVSAARSRSADSSSMPTFAPTFAPTAQRTAPPQSSLSLRGASKESSGDTQFASPHGSQKLGKDTVLLIMASNRPEYLARCLVHVSHYHPRLAVPIIISQDGDRRAVNSVVNNFIEEFSSAATVPVTHLHHRGEGRYENGYFALADHFKWALTQTFSDPLIKRVIILEEDLQIAPDFFEFFAGTAPLLDKDPQLMAVSAWNDNGFASMVKDEKTLYRSDFFPGLGWMMNRAIWEELAPKWPRAYWDDWLREPKQRKGRQFIRPEVCRTLHYGQRGVSMSQYGEFLSAIRLQEGFVHFTSLDLSYLLQPQWDESYLQSVRGAQIVTVAEAKAMKLRKQKGEVRIVYQGQDDSHHGFAQMARQLGIMDNIKASVPRTAYRGIVSFWLGDVKVHLAPRSFA